ncbi:MAG: DNA primase, partial [Chlorobiales bacterium]|nr:DNA primase [Chlorobiales bacterium]
MLIPESKIDEVRRSIDIVDVISDYVKLLPSGRNYKALSPFTNEKTPFFYVSPEKQIYKCFSSGKGGNTFTFVMEMEKLGFIDAVKYVAKRAGIDLSEYERAASPEISKKELTQYEVLTWAARFFHNALNTPEGKECFDYLRDRGLFPETISHFGIGYAYDDWDRLHHEAEKENIPVDILNELGLVSHSEKADKYYDTFRGRAMFPVFSTAGKVVGFGGRILTGQKNTPKYINSPESKLYEKSKLLYAMNFAKDDIRRQDEAILVEGYMDVVSLHQAGLKNVVASSGTSLTPEQAKLIGRFTKNVVFIYDGDSAGIKAMMRGIDILLEQGLTPSIVSLPGDKDPDSHVLEVGGDMFRKYIQDHKTSFLDFKITVLKESEGFETPDKSADSIKELVGTITKIRDELEREVYLKTLANKIDISFGTLQKEAENLLGRIK